MSRLSPPSVEVRIFIYALMRDPRRPGVAVNILSLLPSFVLLEAIPIPSILISISVVPYVIALDRTIMNNISFNLRSYLRFTNIFSRFAIYYRKLTSLHFTYFIK